MWGGVCYFHLMAGHIIKSVTKEAEGELPKMVLLNI